MITPTDAWAHGRCYVFILGGWTPDGHLHIGRCLGSRYHLDRAPVEHDPPTTCDDCGEPLVRRSTEKGEAS